MSTPVIEVSGLRKSYGDVVAVDGIDLVVQPGEIVGILGPNGAGKTTTVECLTGLHTRDAGTVRVLGSDPERDPAVVRRRVGCQLQHSELPARLRVGEALDLFASFYGGRAGGVPADGAARTQRRTERLAEQLGLGPVLGQQFRTLSGGQKQRLSIALALVGDPEVAVLDELTTGLDPQARRDTWELIEDVRRRGVTIVLVSHFMDEAERLCDRLYVVDHGTVVADGTAAELVAATHGAQELRFRTAQPQPGGRVRALLDRLPTVQAIREAPDGGVVVTGTAEVVTDVVLALAGHGIALVDVTASVGTLEDAYVRLTSGASGSPGKPGAVGSATSHRPAGPSSSTTPTTPTAPTRPTTPTTPVAAAASTAEESR